VQVDIAQAALESAQADVVVARSQGRATEGQMRSLRFALEHAIEEIDNQVELLKLRVATLAAKRAALTLAKAENERGLLALNAHAISKEEVDRRLEAMLVAQSQVDEALQSIYQIRAELGLPPQPDPNADLSQVPPDWNQIASPVRQAQASLVEAAARVGVTDSINKPPRQLIADFYKRDPNGDIDRIYDQILNNAPSVKQAESKLVQAQQAVVQAKLNLRYCDVVAEIDGVVTRREANPGNNVLAGQSLMVVRSLTEIWIDANFKETQLARLRIGQAADLDVDMYGRRKKFRGRISGFTIGTGSALSLLPPENATGNFVKVVQRLPVRIELVDYHPDESPLFIGLSVTPTVRLREAPTGPNAGAVLRPPASPAENPASGGR
jgi:membrane fusion protein (multidrug efflux system)